MVDAGTSVMLHHRISLPPFRTTDMRQIVVPLSLRLFRQSWLSTCLIRAGVDHVLTNGPPRRFKASSTSPSNNIWRQCRCFSRFPPSRHLENDRSCLMRAWRCLRARAGEVQAIESDLLSSTSVVRAPMLLNIKLIHRRGCCRSHLHYHHDDIVDTAGNARNAAGALKEQGALAVCHHAPGFGRKRDRTGF